MRYLLYEINQTFQPRDISCTRSITRYFVYEINHEIFRIRDQSRDISCTRAIRPWLTTARNMAAACIAAVRRALVSRRRLYSSTCGELDCVVLSGCIIYFIYCHRHRRRCRRRCCRHCCCCQCYFWRRCCCCRRRRRWLSSPLRRAAAAVFAATTAAAAAAAARATLGLVAVL